MQAEVVDRMVLCYVLAAVLAVIVAFYWVLDLHYFIRMGLCVLHARFFKRRVHILDTTDVTGELSNWFWEFTTPRCRTNTFAVFYKLYLFLIRLTGFQSPQRISESLLIVGKDTVLAIPYFGEPHNNIVGSILLTQGR